MLKLEYYYEKWINYFCASKFTKYLEEYVTKKLNPEQQNYVFLDEVQIVPEFQKACDSLYIKKNVDLYITGSNAYLLSGELSTLLSRKIHRNKNDAIII